MSRVELSKIQSFPGCGGWDSGVAPAGLGPEMVIFLLRGLLEGAPEVAPAGLGPEMVTFLLRGLLARAPEVAPAGLEPEMVIF